MFSTSMTASSTTTPSATARPPSVMVLILRPMAFIAITAVIKDSGMLTKEISTVFRLPMNRNRMTAISAAPITRSSVMPLSAVSMKLAGRCRFEAYMTTPWAFNAGSRSCSAASTSRVTFSVLAPYCDAVVTSTPGRPMMTASPKSGAGASVTWATSPIWTTAPPVLGISVEAMSAVVAAWAFGTTRIRCSEVSIKPPPDREDEVCVALTTSSRLRSRAASAVGSTRTSSRRTSPPKTTARATPGTASRRGRIVHCTRSRSAFGSSLSETKPILSKSMVDEVRGATTGRPTPDGNCASARASETIWRAR